MDRTTLSVSQNLVNCRNKLYNKSVPKQSNRVTALSSMDSKVCASSQDINRHKCGQQAWLWWVLMTTWSTFRREKSRVSGKIPEGNTLISANLVITQRRMEALRQMH